MVSKSIYNLKINTIYMYDIPFDRTFLQLSNGIRHVMPSTDTKPELTAKASIRLTAGCVCQWVNQPSIHILSVRFKNLSNHTKVEDPQRCFTVVVTGFTVIPNTRKRYNNLNL
jgi:hypothetical protein